MKHFDDLETRSAEARAASLAECLPGLIAIAQKLPELPAGAKVLGFNYDTGERYLSVEGYLPV